MANIIEDIMELRHRYLREYYANFIEFSEEFKKEYDLFSDKTYILEDTKHKRKLLKEVDRKESTDIEPVRKNYDLVRRTAIDPKKHIARIMSGNMPVDSEWMNYLLEKLHKGQITEQHFILGSFIVFPDFGVIDESDMITVVEKMSFSKDIQEQRIEQISKLLGVPEKEFKAKTLDILMEHQDEYQAVKRIGTVQRKQKLLEQKQEIEDFYNVGKRKLLGNGDDE